MKVNQILGESIKVKEDLAQQTPELEKVEKVAEKIAKSLEEGKKVVLFGNGGSAADAQHIACELSGKFRLERTSLPAISLTTNTSALTAIGNDFGYDQVFSRQVEGTVNSGDVVIGISTSGSSPNVIKGVKAARKRKAITVGLTGSAGDKLCKAVDICIRVPSEDTARIQESHITIGHIICELVEDEIFG